MINTDVIDVFRFVFLVSTLPLFILVLMVIHRYYLVSFLEGDQTEAQAAGPVWMFSISYLIFMVLAFNYTVDRWGHPLNYRTPLAFAGSIAGIMAFYRILKRQDEQIREGKMKDGSE